MPASAQPDLTSRPRSSGGVLQGIRRLAAFVAAARVAESSPKRGQRTYIHTEPLGRKGGRWSAQFPVSGKLLRHSSSKIEQLVAR